MINTVFECSVLLSTGMFCIGWSSLLRPALCWYRLVGMRAAGSLILPREAISPGATILAPHDSKWTVCICLCQYKWRSRTLFKTHQR